MKRQQDSVWQRGDSAIRSEDPTPRRGTDAWVDGSAATRREVIPLACVRVHRVRCSVTPAAPVALADEQTEMDAACRTTTERACLRP